MRPVENGTLRPLLLLNDLDMLGSGPIKYAPEASKWRRTGSKMPAVDSYSNHKGILFRDRSHFDVLWI